MGRVNERKRWGLPRYFFLKVAGEGPFLHKAIQANRAQDIVTVFCYDKNERYTLSYTFVKANLETAYNTHQVGQMLNRSYRQLNKLINNGSLDRPSEVRAANGDSKVQLWHEDDIWNAHEWFSNTRRGGNPRKDGKPIAPNPIKLPTPVELRAMLRQDAIMYIKDESTGEFVPVWKAPDFS